MFTYKVQLNQRPKKSILYFEEKDNPVKHIVALCSRVWQRNQKNMSTKAGT